MKRSRLLLTVLTCVSSFLPPLVCRPRLSLWNFNVMHFYTWKPFIDHSSHFSVTRVYLNCSLKHFCDHEAVLIQRKFLKSIYLWLHLHTGSVLFLYGCVEHAQQLEHMGPVASGHVGSQLPDLGLNSHPPHTRRWIPNHQADPQERFLSLNISTKLITEAEMYCWSW